MKVAFVVHQYPPRYNTGTEIYAHRMAVTLRITRADGTQASTTLLCRVDTLREVAWMRHGGVLPYALAGMAAH